MNFQISFAALGATTMAHLSNSGVPWLVALVVSGLLTIPVGVLIAIPAIRFSGIYLALITFGFGLLMQYVLYPSSLMFGTSLSTQAKRLHLGPIVADMSDVWQYYVALGVTAVAVAVLIALHRSRFGRLLRGLAESPMMLATLGLNVTMTRLLLFSISAFFAGLSGALMSSQYAVSAVSFNPIISLTLVAILGICGLVGGRLILTAALAAVLLSILPGYVGSFDTDHQTLDFGVLAIIAGLIIANRPALQSWLRGQVAASRERLDRGPAADRGQWRPRPFWERDRLPFPSPSSKSSNGRVNSTAGQARSPNGQVSSPIGGPALTYSVERRRP